MSNTRRNYAGRAFGRLTAVEPTDKKQHNCVVWKMRCRCGRSVELVPSRRGSISSCGRCNEPIEFGARAAIEWVEGTECAKWMDVAAEMFSIERNVLDARLRRPIAMVYDACRWVDPNREVIYDQ